MSKIKTVTKDKVTLHDGTKIMFRNRDIDLRKEYYENIYDALTDKVDKNKPLSGFVEKDINALKKTLADAEYNNTAGRRFEKIINDTQDFLDQSKTVDIDFKKYMVDREMFTWQKDFLKDKAMKITMLAGRRSGKSYAMAGKAIDHCLEGYDTFGGVQKKRKVLILGLTQTKVAEIFWHVLILLANNSKLSFKQDNTNKTITFSNGASIELLGNTSKADRERIRGQEYSLVLIDECQSQASLDYLIEDILGPIILGRDSQLILAGTGSISGYCAWADRTTGDLAKNFKHYTATMADNPTIPGHELALETIRLENNWDENNVTYQREYLGKNVRDTNRVIFNDFTFYKTIPEDFVASYCCLGLDYGWADKTAIVPIVVGQGKDGIKKAYIYNDKSFNRTGAEEIVKQVKDSVKDIQEVFKLQENQIMVVADTSDQSISADIQKKGVRLQNAYKVDKRFQIEVLRDAIRNGTLSIIEKTVLHKEMLQMIWKFDNEQKAVIYEIDESTGHVDSPHAAQYGFYWLQQKKHI